MFRNDALDKGDWLDAVMFDEGPRRVPPKTFEDPAITLDVQAVAYPKNIKKDGKALDRFNLSNDWAYEGAKSQRADRVRQVVGPAVIEHALPAVKLHFQYVCLLQAHQISTNPIFRSKNCVRFIDLLLDSLFIRI